MVSRETLDKVIAAFDNNDADGVIALFAEDGEWNMLGDYIITGHEQLRAFFAKNSGMEMLEFTKDHVVIDGDTAVVDGLGSCRDQEGKVTHMFYCDIYDFENDKVKSLRSYIRTKKD